MPRVKIIDAFGVGYAKGKEYEVSDKEAKTLIDNKNAMPVKSEKKKATATAKKNKVETR